MLSHCAFFESHARQAFRPTLPVQRPDVKCTAYIPHVPCLEQADQSASLESIIDF
jgi:hypothetical protein